MGAICQNRMNSLMNNCKGFYKISKPTKQDGTYYLHLNCHKLYLFFGRGETKNWKISPWWRNFHPMFSFTQRKTTASGFSKKSLLHLTFNRNFWIMFGLMVSMLYLSIFINLKCQSLLVHQSQKLVLSQKALQGS